jgi:hypothetical protein
MTPTLTMSGYMRVHVHVHDRPCDGHVTLLGSSTWTLNRQTLSSEH